MVEENLHPRAVHSLPLVPSPARGWPLTPADLGRVVDVPGLGVQGRLLSINYDEAQAPMGSTPTVLVELEETGAIPGAGTTVRAFGAAQYGPSTYQEET